MIAALVYNLPNWVSGAAAARHEEVHLGILESRISMDPEKLSENRCQLASLARLKKRRRVGREFPCDWRPSTVTSPEDNQPFTEAGAWEFIAQMLEDEPAQEVTLLTLDRPAGKTALVMKRVLPAHSTSKSNTAADPAFWGAAFITAIIEAKP